MSRIVDDRCFAYSLTERLHGRLASQQHARAPVHRRDGAGLVLGTRKTCESRMTSRIEFRIPDDEHGTIRGDDRLASPHDVSDGSR